MAPKPKTQSAAKNSQAVGMKSDSTGSKSVTRPTKQRSRQLIQELEGMPTVEFTEWAFEQAKIVVDTNVELEQTETFPYVCAFADASEEERTVLTNKGFKGFKELPGRRRGEVVVFMMKHGDIMSVLLGAAKKSYEKGNGEALEPKAMPSTAVEDETKAAKRKEIEAKVAAAKVAQRRKADEEQTNVEKIVEEHQEVQEKSDSESEDEVARSEEMQKVHDRRVFQSKMESNLKEMDKSVETPEEKQEREETQKRGDGTIGLRPGFLLSQGCKGGLLSKQRPRALEKMKQFAKEAKLDNIDFQDAAAEAFKDLIQPGQVLDAVAELNENERGNLAHALLDAGVVAAEGETQLVEVVRPGGIADKLLLAKQVSLAVWKYLWVLVLINALELSSPQLFRSQECGTHLQTWLKVDAAISTAAIAFGFVATRTCAPVVEMWNKDAVGTAATLRRAMSEAVTWEARFEQSFPGVGFATLKQGIALVLLMLSCMAVGSLLAWMGALLLLTSGPACMSSGNTTLLGVASLFVVLRSGISLLLVVPVAWYVRRRPREQGKLLGTAEHSVQSGTHGDVQAEESMEADSDGDDANAELAEPQGGLDVGPAPEKRMPPKAAALREAVSGPNESDSILFGLGKCLKQGIQDWCQEEARKMKKDGSGETLENLSEALLQGVQAGREGDARTEDSAGGFLDSMGELLWAGMQQDSAAGVEGGSAGFFKNLSTALRVKVQEVCHEAVKVELARRADGRDDVCKVTEGVPQTLSPP